MPFVGSFLFVWTLSTFRNVPTGLDLLSLDGSHAVGCWNASVSFKEVRRFLRMARWVYKAREIGVSTEGA